MDSVNPASISNQPSSPAQNAATSPASNAASPPPPQTVAPEAAAPAPTSPPPSANPTTTESIVSVKAKTKRLALTLFSANLAILLAVIGFNYYTANKLKLLQLNKQQILSTQANNRFLQEASGYVDTRSENIDYILSVLPTDSTLVDFIQTVEFVAQAHTNAITIDFDARTPSGAEGEQFIPININLSTDPLNFSAFLKKLEKLPYIVQVTAIESSLATGSDAFWNYKIKSRLYVRDDFYAPTAQGK